MGIESTKNDRFFVGFPSQFKRKDALFDSASFRAHGRGATAQVSFGKRLEKCIVVNILATSFVSSPGFVSSICACQVPVIPSPVGPFELI